MGPFGVRPGLGLRGPGGVGTPPSMSEVMVVPDGVARHGDVELAYWERGEGPDTVLLVMGIVMRAAFWRPAFIDALARQHRVICFDNRGTGASTREMPALTPELWAGDALAVLDAVGAEQASIIGYSMGGRVTQQLMVDHPDRVQRAVMLSAAVGGPRATQPQERALSAFAPAGDRTPEAMRRDGMVAIAGRGFAERDPASAAEYVALGATQPTSAEVIMKQIGVAKTDVTDALSATQTPLMIVHGDDDSLVPIENGHLIHGARPDAHFVTLPGVGHCVQFEATDRLVECVGPFLRGE